MTGEANLPISEQVNVWRDDVVEETVMLSQEQALAQAEKTYEGYMQVPLVIEK